MGKKWDYADMAHDAKLHGGPEKYLDFIKESSRRVGKLEGKAEGKTEMLVAEGFTLGICLLGYAGYKAISAIKEKHEKESIKEQEEAVIKAEEELISGMKMVLEEESDIDHGH